MKRDLIGTDEDEEPRLDLQNKSLERIENLEGCSELSYINASKNLIAKIDDLSVFAPNLGSLLVARNKLSKPDSIRNVIHLKQLRELDLAHNEINCSLESILEILAQCKSLKILSLKGNPITETKHFRKLVISRCPNLVHLDGRPVCGEERRRCNAWGQVVRAGGSYGEADCADSLELNTIRSEQSKANALRRTSLRTSNCSDRPKTTGTNYLFEGIKRTFGLIDTRRASSTISWSSSLRTSLLSQDDTGKLSSKLLMKTELEQVKRTVELQRNEIINLKKSLESSKKASARPIHGMDSINDSERDTSYSLLHNEQLAHQANLKEKQQAFPDITWEDCIAQTNNTNPSPSAIDKNSSSMAIAGGHGFDPFSVFPPVPPPQHNVL